MRLRAATLADLAELLPPRLPRLFVQAYALQLRRSAAFTAVDDAGVALVGGLYPDPESCERECWLHLRSAPRVRVKDLLVAVVTVLEAAGEGWPIVAHVDAGSPRDLRFAEFLGFVTRAEVPATTVTPRSLKLVRSV
jgi:hypothetical protein